MKILCVMLFTLLLVSGCVEEYYCSNNNDSKQISNNGSVTEIEIINEIDTESNKETDENDVNKRENSLFPDDVWEEQRAQRRLNNVAYMIRGDYTPAGRDADLLTIERFVFFTDSTSDTANIFVIDKLQSKVYYNPEYLTTSLERMEYSDILRGEDLERLIVMIEESSMRDWDVVYRGEQLELEDNQYVEDNVWVWGVSILFSDGTMLRRSGGMDDESRPLREQFDILTDFIKKMGEEIIERHNARHPNSYRERDEISAN